MYRLLLILLCVCCLLLPCILYADQPTEPSTQTTKPKNYSISIQLKQASSTTILKQLKTPIAEGGVKELVPAGLEGITEVQSINSLLVRATDEAALKVFIRLISLMDVAKLGVRVKVMSVKLPQAESDVLLGEILPSRPFYEGSWKMYPLSRDILESALRKLTENNRVKFSNRSQFLIENADTDIDIRPTDPDMLVQGLPFTTLRMTIHEITIDSVTCSLRPVLPDSRNSPGFCTYPKPSKVFMLEPTKDEGTVLLTFFSIAPAFEELPGQVEGAKTLPPLF